MAIGPIDYSSLQVQPDLIGDFAKGYQLGQGIRNDQQQQQQLQQQRDLQAQYGKDLTAAMQNGSPKAMAWLVAKYPQQREAFKQSWDILSADQQKNELSSAGGVYAALQSGRPDIAVQQLDQHIAALKNSGQDATQLQNLRDTIDQNPQAATSHAGFVLSSIMGPEKFTDTFGNLGSEARAEQLQPFNIAQKGAEAAQAVTSAQNAPEQQALGMQKTQAEIGDIQVKQQLSALDKQIAQANSETERGKLQLERDKLVQQQQLNGNSVQQNNQSSMDSASNLINAVDDILNDPYMKESLNSPLIGGVGSMTGKLTAVIPGTDRGAFDDKISSLKSKLALDAINQLKSSGGSLGPFTDKDVELVMNSIRKIHSDMKPEALKTALNVIKATTQKAQNKLVASGKLPTSGGAFVMQHPVYGNVTEGDINKLMASHPGSTREQVIQYLNQTKGGQ